MSEQFENPTNDAIRRLLGEVKRIAVVGLSPKPARPSYMVAEAMQGYGYEIVPVRPATAEVLGARAYPSLLDVPGGIDLVDVFRAPEHVGPIVDACIERKVPYLWLQEGVVNHAEANRAKEAGMVVVMNRCLYKDYLALTATEGGGDGY